MLEFVNGIFRQFLLDYKSGGFMEVLNYIILAGFILSVIALAVFLTRNLIQQMMLKKTNYRVSHAVAIEKKVIRRPFFMKIFGQTKDRYLVVLRSKKFNKDLEYEDVEFYAHSQLGKKYEAEYYEIYMFGNFKELRITNVKFIVN
jgi:hypothetical protein